MSYTQILYHIVFATHERRPCLGAENRERLFKYVHGFLDKRDCVLYRMNGTDDHVHILCSVHPSISLADLIRDLKKATTHLNKEESLFPKFTRWQEGYGAFTCSYKDKDAIIRYVANQEDHHRTVTFAEEFEAMLKAAGIEYDPRYI